MSKIVNRIAAVAALALAATPIIGLTAAHAAEPAQPVARILVGDLTLSNPADAREFERRATVAGARVCAGKGLRGLTARGCRMDFAIDVKDAMTEQQLADLKAAQRAGAHTTFALN
ncbi:UrcA family protein [Caulobacter sp.]|uniref:UrcA family protein n=1 Tax=Caulobacter sp. TaxID=78 RepID=UPI001B267F60|nr:UrcA family protein [Caulobacter sp.]MBO9546482.1 UrcA family protein [Caulobacter sp.]